MEHKTVIVVGAGPVGLLIALRLAQAGVSVLVLERHDELLHAARACVYQPVVLKAFESLGILDTFRTHGSENRDGIAWRDVLGKELAALPLLDDEFVLHLGQWRMNRVLIEELEKFPGVQVRFSHQVVGIEQNDEASGATVMVHHTIRGEDVTFSADWVVGADGANSSVRKMLCIPFEGYTYRDFRMIGIDLLYDFVAEQHWRPLNFVVHPHDWAVVTYTGENENEQPYGNGRKLWRIAYSEPPEWDASHKAVWERAQERVKLYTQGRTDFTIMRAEPYTIQQRCAKQGRKGRAVLAGDALHSNNPIGGLGLTGGILDAFVYGNALVRVICHGEADTLLTQCAESRRQAWRQSTGPTTEVNLATLRLEDEETVKAREAFFHNLNEDAGFPRKARASLDEMLKEDFRELGVSH